MNSKPISIVWLNVHFIGEMPLVNKNVTFKLYLIKAKILYIYIKINEISNCLHVIKYFYALKINI